MNLFEPAILMPGDPPVFPDPRRSDADGLVAIGGDLSVPRLLAAYRTGIFPWYDPATPPLWWSPDPRGVIVPERLHVPRRVERTARGSALVITWNRAFHEVIRHCAERRTDGTWLVPEMISAYVTLHRAGHAHSLEVWRGDRLVGGLYGVQVGAVFAAESKFHREPGASKLALVAAVRSLAEAGVELIDVQIVTGHLATFGAEEWSRARYLAALARLADRSPDLSALVPHAVPRARGSPGSDARRAPGGESTRDPGSSLRRPPAS